MKHNITYKDGDIASIVVIADGKPLTVTPGQATFKRILDAVEGRTGPHTDDEIVSMFSIASAVKGAFAQISDRITVNGSIVRFDMMPVDNAITEAIARFYNEGNANWVPLVNFMEKIMTNMTPHSRDQAFTWLANKSYGIFPDGDIVGYKYVGHGHLSSHRGHAFVNGVEYGGGHHEQIPHPIGAIVEMPRDEVAHDPGNACSAGLHVGSWEYSSGGGAHMILVKINPRDIVSVPTDAGGGKMRVCRYHVIMDVTGRGDVLSELGISFPNIELKTLLRGDKGDTHFQTAVTKRAQKDIKSWRNQSSIESETLPASNAPAGVLDDGELDAHGEDVNALRGKTTRPKRGPSKPKRDSRGRVVGTPKKATPTKKAAPVKKAAPKPVAKKAAAPVAKVAKKAPIDKGPKPIKETAKKTAPVKKVAADKIVRTPKSYEEFTRAQFEVLKRDELVYVAKAWDVSHTTKTTASSLVDMLVDKAHDRRGARTTAAGKRKIPLTALRG